MSWQTLSREGSLEGDKSSSFANFFLKYLQIDLNLRIIAYFFFTDSKYPISLQTKEGFA